MANRLAGETSPYLLQHAENPVDWYPWGPEALERAKSEDRPILLSIGYSACHWCHVMERESFEDDATAAVMNQAFINIKVDREERPDLDSVYMKAVQAMTGQGGWPLTAFLTPEGAPYFGGTYFPPEPRHGMPSFHQVLDAAGKAYHDRRSEVLDAGNQLKSMLDRSSKEPHPTSGRDKAFTSATVEGAVAFAARSYDAVQGGFGSAPKFPQPVVLDLLLRSGSSSDATGSGVAMATHTLTQMAAGGMRDHLGGGFHRYSVDAKWLVPHFEKMLYDNALLARSYAYASILNADPGLGQVATAVLDDMIDDLGSPEGPFYSARDADSEGEEGTFYLWTPEQLADALDKEVARLFGRCYDVSEVGNFEGKNILHLPHDLDAVARDEGMSRAELDGVLSKAAGTLEDVRAKREAPLLDDKVLTSWNGMTIRALAEVGTALARPDLLGRAVQAAEFVIDTLVQGDELFHVYGGGRSYVPGFLEDYGALGNACVSLFEATLNPRWVEEAEWLGRQALERFWSEPEGAFYDTAEGSEPLLIRPRDIMDNATPSGNSLIVELLLRLAAINGEEALREPATRVIARELGVIEKYPTAVARLGVAGILAHTPKLEVTLVGSSEDVYSLLGVAHRHVHPNRVISGGDPSDPRSLSLPALEGRTNHVGNAFVCVGSTCQEPVGSAEGLDGQLTGIAAG